MASSDQIVALIAAVGANGAIGLGNRLLWNLPEDMAYFKQTTQGRPVIMGRKTWESLPERFRPLPGRHNIVVTRNADYLAPGASVAHSLEAALTAAGVGEVFVIGGAELYTQALARAHRLYLTEVADTPAADAFFPTVSPSQWREVS
ncbi:MAG: dihydrofolate reductase, partial [Betaproteobacteria bacterium]|nr:dihydrofolate reductase [Betaproteobacteria bacterium]